MAGVTYTHFSEGEPCWIVVDSPFGKEYLHGEFVKELPPDHPAYKLVRERMPPAAKAVVARITDTNVKDKHPVEALEYGKEPYRHYTLMPSNAYTNHLVQQVELLRGTMRRACDQINHLERILVEVASKKE